jgi:putative transposase
VHDRRVTGAALDERAATSVHPPAMPSRPRIILANVPLHITQRGVDRRPTFLADEDFTYYRWALREARIETRCAVHAYVLMSNHVHLLVTPSDVNGPARLLASLGRRYVRYFNDRYRRTGTLWEGRYRSTLVDSATYFLACSRYIELNPVRAGLVEEPGAYEWSSYRHNALGGHDAVVTPHALFATLGGNPASSRAGYRALFAAAVPSSVVATFRVASKLRPALHSTPCSPASDAVLVATATPTVDGASTRHRAVVVRMGPD